MNSTKGIKNLTFGIVAQILAIGLGIVIPRLVLINLGSEANGLLNSISSILSYMTLLEAGVGTATLQALYKPFGENNHDEINSIMAATNYFYRRTGYIYLVLVILLSIFYTLTINTTISKISVFCVVILSGLSGVLSYFFQGKYKIFLTAEGKNYIITNIATMATVGVSISKAILLLLGCNIVIIQSIYFVFNLIQMILISVYIYRHYKWLNLSVKANFEAISQKNAVLVHQLTELIFNNTDTILLTYMVSLKAVSVYTMYIMIFGMVKSLAVTFADSYIYMLGQSYHNKERFNKLFDVYEVYNMSITFALFCVSFILILPFLKLYTEGVNDIDYIDFKLALLFVILYLLQNGRKASQVVINIAQHFEKTKWRAVAEATINIVASVILTPIFGIYGVLLGTIIALLYRTNDVIWYASKLLKRTPAITYCRWFINIVTFIIVSVVIFNFPIHIKSYVQMMMYGSGVVLIVVPTFIVIDSLVAPRAAKILFVYIKHRIVGKLLN